MNLLKDPLNVKDLGLVGLADVKVKLIDRGAYDNCPVELAPVKLAVVHKLLDECALAGARLSNEDGEEVRLQVLFLLGRELDSFLPLTLVVRDQGHVLHELMLGIVLAVIVDAKGLVSRTQSHLSVQLNVPGGETEIPRNSLPQVEYVCHCVSHHLSSLPL